MLASVTKETEVSNPLVDQIPFSPKRVKEERVKRGWEQKDLAERSGLSQGAISQIEAGNANPKERVLRKLGKAFGILWLPDWREDDWDNKKEAP